MRFNKAEKSPRECFALYDPLNFFAVAKRIKGVKILPILLIIIFSLSVSSFGATKWKNALRPGGKLITVRIVSNNQPNYTIVVPADTQINENLASKDLAEFLGKIYGVKFKIVKDTDKFSGNFISLGDTKQLKADKTLTIPDTKAEGYGILYNPTTRNIYIVGGYTSGALNGVYALLEEDLGVRFYTARDNGVVRVSKNNLMSFVPRNYTPQFLQRFISLPEYTIDRLGGVTTLFNKERPFIRRNRLHSWEPNGGCHTVFNFCPKSNFDEHPEWFSMYNGKREPKQVCWSNKEMLEVMAKNAVQEMHNYAKDTICISPNDSFPCCACPECEAFDKAHGNTKAASLINGMNYIAEAVTKEFPHTTVQTLAYLDTIKPPTDLPIHPNMQIIVCSDSCDWDYPLCTYDESNEFQNNAKAWLEYAPSVMSWTYVCNYDHLLIPNPNNEVEDKNIKLMKEWGFKGCYLQGIGWNSFISGDGYFKTWVWGKLLWNPNLDYEALKKDFCYGYYGEAIGEEILKYENSLDEMYETAHAKPHDPNEKSDIMIADGLPVFNTPPRDNEGVVFDKGIRWTPEVKMYTEEWINNSEAIFDKCMKLAKTDEDIEKVRYARLPIYYLKLCRNLGYLRLGGKVSKSPNDATREKMRPYFDEFHSMMEKYGVKVVAEISDQQNSRANYEKMWKQKLALDMKGIGLENIPNDGWKFMPDKENVGYSKGYFDPNFDTSSWSDIKTGLTWDEQGFGTIEANAWYKKKINISEDVMKAREIYLLFTSVDEEATVYVNGHLAIEHTMAKLGLTPNEIYKKSFIVKMKQFLQVGENDITIMVGNVAKAGGLYTPVKLSWTYKNVPDEQMLVLCD